MFKNVAGQKIKLFAFIPSTGLARTGDAANLTAYVSKDNGAVTALTDTSATEMSATNAPGWYLFDLTQAETDANDLLFSGKSSTADTAVVGSHVFTDPANYTSMLISAAGRVTVSARLQKNQAIADFQITMTDSTTHNPSTGKTVTVTRLLADGSFAAIASPTVTEIANGVYVFDLAAADLNADTVTLLATASGCDPLIIHLLLEP